jgi:hypothetical protein
MSICRVKEKCTTKPTEGEFTAQYMKKYYMKIITIGVATYIQRDAYVLLSNVIE